MTAEEEIRLGQEAQHVLANMAYQKAWKELEEALKRTRNETPITDIPAIQSLVMFERAMDKLKSMLETYVKGGKLKAEELKRIDPVKRSIWDWRRTA
jgi:hypothetical protein